MEDHPRLSELRAIPIESLRDWVISRFPDGASPYWWRAVFELIETAVSPLRTVDRSARISDLRLGAEAVTLAVERRDIDAATGAFWLLRLAAAALRLDLHVDEVPNFLTPDGAAAWTLAQFPLSREAAVAESRVWMEECLAADESFFAPAGVSNQSYRYEPDPRVKH